MPRSWGKNIVIDGSWYNTRAGRTAFRPRPGDRGDGYEKDVQDILRTSECGSSRYGRTRVGSLLIRWIARRPQQLRIEPVAWGDFENVQARPRTVIDSLRPDWFGTREGGTGNGTDVVIAIEPHAFRGFDTKSGYDRHGDMDPEAALVHELFHALRYMLGVATRVPVGAGFDDLEEFYAVLIENIYRSETGRTAGLRADHDAVFHRLSDKLLTVGVLLMHPDFYYETYKEAIDALCDTPGMRSFFRELGDLSYPAHVWNPIRAWTEMLARGSWPIP